MKNNLILLAAIIVLYLVPSLILQVVYGPSFGFMSGEDSWVSDGHGGWAKHGNPADPAPADPSVEVPVGVRYIPIFLPAALLVLFLFTPLGRKLEPPKEAPPPEPPDDIPMEP
jgi:hypothetical protein